MMRLSLMKRFFQDVSGSWPEMRSPLADRVAAAWDADAGSVRVIRASANVVCFFTRGKERLVLRLCPEEQRDRAAVEGELAWIDRLARAGITVNRPVATGDGRLVIREQTPLGPMVVVCLERLAGEHREAESIGVEDCTAWGRALGLVHAASLGWRAPGRPVLPDLTALSCAPGLPAADARLVDAVVGGARRRLSRLLADEGRHATLHGDFEADNLLFDGPGLPGIIDCDNCAWGHVVVDVAWAVSEICDDRPSRFDAGEPRMRAFTAGYRRAMPLSDEELAAVPDFLILACANRLCRLLAIREEGRENGEPEWFTKIREKIGGALEADREEMQRALDAGR